MRSAWLTLATVFGMAMSCLAQHAIDERTGGEREWGFRPSADEVVERDPPAFSWRPQKGATTYTIQVASDERFEDVVYEAAGVVFNVHSPSRSFGAGRWYWRFGVEGAQGERVWSEVRSFVIGEGAGTFVLPPREVLLSRVPDSHPRLFVRPEGMGSLRGRMRGDLRNPFNRFLAKCDGLLHDPPATAEPPKYQADIVRGSDPWRAVWWGNRTYTIRLLDGAAQLGFAYQLTGDDRYGLEARRLLMAAARWDPKGSTGYRYNDEAGMPYAYHFSRTYTFVHELLTEEEREVCRNVMRIRGAEMYRHLHPRHLWQPYSSHSNRAWHFLGEVAIAFHGEIDEADDWLWFAVNVFANVYPVWSDADGGWHEGMNYWSSYVGRFTWWADVMREAVGVDAFQLPYFSQVGYYAMYMTPPGTKGGGFGDLNARFTTNRLRPLMTVLATQSQNPHWSWYVEEIGGASYTNDFIGLLRADRSMPAPVSPGELEPSRLFAGTGQAVLNATIERAADNVEVIFKSSPFGTQSHGYESQNAFLLYAFGERLLIRSGYRDSYGSKHHKEWMWQTKSVNSVTVNGKGQKAHAASATGAITDFYTSDWLDAVEGEAAPAYGGALERFTRTIVFVKPDLIVIYDQLEAKDETTFEWLLHAPAPFEIEGERLTVRNGGAACTIAMLVPDALDISTTDQFDPPPRSRIQLTEHHMTAKTTKLANAIEFVTVIRPFRSGEMPPSPATVERVAGGYVVRATVGGRDAGGGTGQDVRIMLKRTDAPRIQSDGLESVAQTSAVILAADGSPMRIWRATQIDEE